MSLPAAPAGSGSDIAYGAVIERPRVIYNTQTSQFVMWFHVDDAPAYAYARAGLAVANSPEGPYTYLGSVRPMGYESRDITVFRDDDGTGWLVYITAVNGDSNRAIRIAKLTPDYLGFTGEAVQFQDAKKREAPTILKRNGFYYLWTSGTNWWHPTAAKVHRATSMLGPWTDLGNPAVGVDSHITFNSQGTHVLSIAGRPDQFMFMGDRWNGNYLPSSRYVWLPIRWEGDRPRIDSPTPWNPYPEFM
jgi:beta-xylosidase